MSDLCKCGHERMLHWGTDAERGRCCFVATCACSDYKPQGAQSVAPAPACRCAELAAEIERLRGVISKARHDIIFLPNDTAGIADEIAEIGAELQAALEGGRA